MKTAPIRVRKITQLQLSALAQLFSKPTSEILEVAVNEIYQKNLNLLVVSEPKELLEVVNHV
jgi:hypothetical protein